MEIAGQSEALLSLRSKGIGSVVAVSLNDFRNTIQRVVGRLKGLRYVTGDITSGTTWGDIGKQQFELIVCRPMAATGVVKSPILGLVLLDKMYKSLSINGVLLVQFHPELVRNSDSGWILKLAKTPGIRVNYRDNVKKRAEIVMLSTSLNARKTC